MSLIAQIESLLFVSPEAISLSRLVKATGGKKTEIQAAIKVLSDKYRQAKDGGITLVTSGDSYQLVTSAANAQLVSDWLKSDLSGELSEPSLETLTIIAYRGPITKPEIELIRGVNCSLILRNLLMRGLVEKEESGKHLPKYTVTVEFLRFLGVGRVSDLPDYDKLAKNETLEEVLNSSNEEK